MTTPRDAISGPCCICGATNYALSCGGPSICPTCDCGNFGAEFVKRQKVQLDSLLKERDALQADLQVKDHTIYELQQERNMLERSVEAFEAQTANADALQARVKELEAERNFWKSERDRIKAFLSEGDWQTVESEQAWRKRALRAEQERDEAYERVIQAVRDAPSPDADGYYTMTKEDVIAIVRRLLAGPEKEKKE